MTCRAHVAAALFRDDVKIVIEMITGAATPRSQRSPTSDVK